MKRRVIQLVLLLIAGAIVNVAIGLTLAVIQIPRAAFLIQPLPMAQWPEIDAMTGRIYLSPDERDWMANRRSLAWQVESRFRDERTCLGKRNITYARSMSEYWGGTGLLRFDGGWPMFAFTGQGLGFASQRLPDGVLWPGFAINTIFYAAVLWVVFFVPGKLRRTLRRRRGQCPACAYPVGTSKVCTECGAAVRVHT